MSKTRTYKTGPDGIVYTLVLFSTFEELKLPIKGPVEEPYNREIPNQTGCCGKPESRKLDLGYQWIIKNMNGFETWKTMDKKGYMTENERISSSATVLCEAATFHVPGPPAGPSEGQQ